MSRATAAWRAWRRPISALDHEWVRLAEKGSRSTPLTRRQKAWARASFAAFCWLEDALGALLFAAMLVVVLMQVFVRFLLFRWVQIAWADEIGRALLVWSSFWGAVLVTRESHHITVDLLYDRLPSGARWSCRVAADVVVSVFLLVVLWKGSPILLDSVSRPSPATNLPAFIFDGALGVSSVLMLFHIVVNAFERWRPATTIDISDSTRAGVP